MENTYALISLENLKHNYNEIKKAVGNTQMACVVKADAYGHGDKVVASYLEKLGASFFCVACINEALSLREAGVKGEILILGYTPCEEVRSLWENNISQAVYSAEYAKELSENAEKEGVSIKSHLVIDTGMGRIGFCEEPSFIADAVKLPGLNVEGVFTHYSSADMFDDDSVAYTEGQENLFRERVKALQDMGISFKYIHSCNSAASLKKQNDFTNLCRVGIILYGLKPSDDEYDIDLKPVMSLRSVVSMVKNLPSGKCVSYGREYITTKDTTVATVAVGYADGYRRALRNAEVIINSVRCPIIGRICMDQIMVDVTEAENAKMGDEVVLIGEGITAEELAEIGSTNNYEIVCNVSKRVGRHYTPEK